MTKEMSVFGSCVLTRETQGKVFDSNIDMLAEVMYFCYREGHNAHCEASGVEKMPKWELIDNQGEWSYRAQVFLRELFV